jgi:tetratricopeptide (TPR) repeat protein
MHEVKTEIEGEHVGEAGSARGRLIAIATVLTTLAAATTGYMQTSAVKAHDEAAVKAERLAALAVNVSAGNEDQAQAQIDRYQTWLDERTHARAAAAAAPRLGRPARLEAARWTQVATLTARNTRTIARRQVIKFACDPGTATCQTRGLSPLCSPKPNGAGCVGESAEGANVNRYRETAKLESYRLSAEREAANQEADAAESRFSHLAAALIMLAVAVFLFGYSLTPQGRNRRGLFTFVASGFLVIGLGWAILHALSGTDHPPDSAAIAFAKGEVALRSDAYPRAISEFRRAVKLAPKSVDAWVELADAEYASADLSSTGISPAVRDLKRIVTEDQNALDNGSESPTVRFDLGATLLFLGIQTGNDDDIRRARDLSQESVSRFVDQVRQGQHPGHYLVFARFTVAEADLALGAPAMRRDYCKAMQEMVALRSDPLIDIPGVNRLAHLDVNLIRRKRPETSRSGAGILREVDRAERTRRVPACGYAEGG